MSPQVVPTGSNGIPREPIVLMGLSWGPMGSPLRPVGPMAMGPIGPWVPIVSPSMFGPGNYTMQKTPPPPQTPRFLGSGSPGAPQPKRGMGSGGAQPQLF